MASVDRTSQGEVTILRIHGDLTVTEVGAVEPAFRDAAQAEGVRLVVNLADVPQVTTPAISLFVSTATAVKGVGGKVVFGCPQKMVGEVLRRCRLDRVLNIAPTEREAIEMARA